MAKAKQAEVQVDSPELTEFKRKVWFTAQKIMRSHGYEDAIQGVLEHLDLRAEQVMGEGFREPEAEGLYRVEGEHQNTLVIRANAGYTNGQHWFITDATCPRSSGYEPVTWDKILTDLIGRGLVNEKGNWQLNLVKA